MHGSDFVKNVEKTPKSGVFSLFPSLKSGRIIPAMNTVSMKFIEKLTKSNWFFKQVYLIFG
jgi:hypothetical protein